MQMNELKAPCKGCSDRHVSCHGECSKYAEYKRSLTKVYETKRKENAILYYYGSKKRNSKH